MDRAPFLKDGYNYLDFFVVVVSFVSDLVFIVAPSFDGFGIVILRAFRALRPLRFLSRR